MKIAEPMDALVSLQREVRRGMPTQRCDLSPGVRVILDQPNGVLRYTYARIEHGRVKAVALFVHHEPIDGVPCFNLGYAVPEAYRNRGWASEIVELDIQELRQGFGRHGAKSFYVEAVVGKDNLSSLRVASKVISDVPIGGTDSESGEPVFAYTRLVVC
jgi:hypothetical protein